MSALKYVRSSQHLFKKDPDFPFEIGLYSKLATLSDIAFGALNSVVGRSTTRRRLVAERRSEVAHYPQRYVVARLLGKYSIQAINYDLRINRDLLEVAANIFASWALAGVEFDRLMDEEQISSDEAWSLGNLWVRQLSAVAQGGVAVSRLDEFDRFALFHEFTVKLHKATHSLTVERNFTGTGNCERFVDVTKRLMSGQLLSLQQRNATIVRDWRWYFDNILYHKNVDFLLAPFELWAVDEKGLETLQIFSSRFSLLNHFYMNYQLIDDIADMIEDTEDGITGAPGSVLFSLATRRDGGEISGVSLTDLGSHIRANNQPDSGDRYAALLFKIVQQSVIERASTIAPDSGVITHARMYVEAMRRSNYKAAREHLESSRIAAELLTCVKPLRKELQALVGEAIKLESPSEERLFYMLSCLMDHTFSAAKAMANMRIEIKA